MSKPSKAAMELGRVIADAILLDPMFKREEVGKRGLALLEQREKEIAFLIDAHPMLLNLYNALNKAGGKLRLIGFDHRGKCNLCQEEKASDTGTHLKDCLFVLILDAMTNWQPQEEIEKDA